MRRRREWLVIHGPNLALLGVSIAVVAAVVTAVAYSGTDDEPYSSLNHTVSELGERGVSELAVLFNVGLVTGGALIGLYMLGLAFRADPADRAGRGFGVLGAAAGVAMVLVGIFPVDELQPHILAAGLAFLLIFATATWFAVWCLRGSAPYPRWLGWLAAAIAAATVAFLFLPGVLQPEYHFEMEFTTQTPRPDILLTSTLEWLVIGSAWAWIAALAAHDRNYDGATTTPQIKE